MYKMIVGEISRPRREKWDLKSDNPYSVWDGKAYVIANQSADWCGNLLDRQETSGDCHVGLCPPRNDSDKRK